MGRPRMRADQRRQPKTFTLAKETSSALDTLSTLAASMNSPWAKSQIIDRAITIAYDQLLSETQARELVILIEPDPHMSSVEILPDAAANLHQSTGP